MSQKDEAYGILRYEDDRDLMDATAKDGRPRLRIYRPAGVRVVLGRGSGIEEELLLEAIRADGIDVLRRPGGGCSVVLDPGNVVVSVALPVPGLGDTKVWFNRCTHWMIDGLRRAGVGDVDTDGISDLVIGDRKIAGSALYRTKNLLYYSVSLLITADLPLIDRYLAHPPREPEYRKGRSHLDFVTSLEEAAGIEDAEAFAIRLGNVLSVEALMAMGDG